MKRGQFLVSMGKGVLLVCSGSCVLSSCSSGGDDGSPTNGGGNNTGPTTVSINLSALSEIGSQTVKSGILFFRIGAGNTKDDFVATEAVCPHQGGQLVWKEEEGLIECQLHFSQYEPDGDVIRGPQNATGSTRDLKIYPITVSGDTITATKS